MLRGEHVIARLSRGKLVPHRLRPDDAKVLEVAGSLVDVHAARVGRPRRLLEAEMSRLEEELGPRLDPRRGFKVVRALAKLLEEHMDWEAPSEADPYAVRTRLFELAAALPEPPALAVAGNLLGGSTREELLARVAAESRVEDVLALMYADRRGEALLAAFDAPSPTALVERYNVAQVQGVLYAAKGLTVDLGASADARLVFRYVKLLGVIYRLEPLPDGGHRLHLDGPLSLFGGTRKYGLRLAKLLPGLLLTGPWSLRADLDWKGRDAVLDLDSETCGLVSHYKGPADGMTGESDVREAFRGAFARAKDTGGWELRDAPGVLPVPRLKTALAPDFTLLNRETGEEAHLEILGFHSERHLIERVALVREAAERGHRVLVAAPEALNTSPEALAQAARGVVIPFKTRPDPKAVLAALGDGGRASV